MGRNSFILHQNYKEYFEDLTGDEAKELLLAIFDYEKTRIKPANLSTKVSCYFLVIKQQLDKQYQEYIDIVNKNRENGLKGGRPKTQKNPQKPKKPNGLFGNPKNLDIDNDIDNDIVNDNDIDIDNDIKEKEIDKEKEAAQPQVPKAPHTKFQKPTKEDLTTFAQSKQLRTDLIDDFMDYYESNGWKVGRSPMRNWQAAYRRWVRTSLNNKNRGSTNPFLEELRRIEAEEAEEEKVIEVETEDV